MRKTLMVSAAVVGLCGVALAQTDPTCSMYNGMAQGNAPGTRCGGSGSGQAPKEGNAGTTTDTQNRQVQVAPQGGESNNAGVDSGAGGNQAGAAAK